MPFDTPDEVRERFDSVGNGYQQEVADAIVAYNDAAEAIAWRAGRINATPLGVLDLGCGPGAFSLAIANAVEFVDLTLVDFSSNMLRMAQATLSAASNVKVRAECADFRNWSFPPNCFQLVISSLALHHLRPGEKPPIYERICASLQPGGLFLDFDLIKEPDEAWEAFSYAQWKSFMRSQGREEQELEEFFQKLDKEDSPNTLVEEFAFLRDAGFTDIGVVLKRHCFGLIAARKSLN